MLVIMLQLAQHLLQAVEVLSQVLLMVLQVMQQVVLMELREVISLMAQVRMLILVQEMEE